MQPDEYFRTRTGCMCLNKEVFKHIKIEKLAKKVFIKVPGGGNYD